MQTLVAQVLAAWRRAERLTNELAPDTSQHVAAVAAADRLRRVHQELTSWDGWVVEDRARAAVEVSALPPTGEQ